jgi:hypothetical protein
MRKMQVTREKVRWERERVAVQGFLVSFFTGYSRPQTYGNNVSTQQLIVKRERERERERDRERERERERDGPEKTGHGGFNTSV